MSASSPQYLDPPRTGGRVELRLDRQDGEEAVYGARWTTPTGTWQGELFVSAAGSVRVSVQGEEPPPWLLEWTQQLLRTATRSARAEERVIWPRRLTRWRRAPEER